MQWIELSVDTTEEAVDWVRTMSANHYTGEVHITKHAEQNFSGAGDEDVVQPYWACNIRLYLANDVYANERIKEIENLLFPLQRTGMCADIKMNLVETQPPQVEGSSPSIHRIGQRFVVLTPDMPYKSQVEDEVIVRLKTTFSFGSGLHPTTMVSLQLLERHIFPNMNVLDFGSGSGILSVAMAKLGASVLAIDNDSIAVESTQDAVNRNGVEKQVTAMNGSLGHGSDFGHWLGSYTLDNVQSIDSNQTFDLIVANIPARMHIALASDFQQVLRRNARHNGLLIAAGFTTDYENEVTTALAEAGFEVVECERLDEWVGLAYRRK
jgi:ribosomal protein L11 methyltransferase